METIIGADEIILWLRKNQRCQNVSNLILGKRISNLIEDLGGRKIHDNNPSYWETIDGAKNVNEFALPRTSEQYSIPHNSIQRLYDEIVNW